MNIESSMIGDVTLACISGSLDTTTSPAAQERLNAIVDAFAQTGGGKLLIDCTAVDYISSAGLRIFLAIAKRLSASKGSLRMCGLNGNVQEVFEISGFVTIFKVFPTREAALAGF